ncbi:uncharacterized protein LOC116418358 [Nasonia vitripennis]|uniref:Integrase catalytic domain-containing protein n=1 Tax=Nasonia vitripennis TaxID=7425 RepID=A0A7M7QNP2_NASVI|nr:uncharacterized protein LOC116418358 [Nasonia vitripennis]
MLTEKFAWPGIRKDVNSWARSCDSYQRSKVQRHNREALASFEVPDNRFEHVHMDIIVMPLVGNLRYCLTMIDRFSRWPVVVPLADIRAETIAKSFFEHWIAHYGAPITITTDQGTQFESALFTSLARIVGSHKIHTTPYHPQANGLIERFHRTLKAALMCEESSPWPDRLPITMLGLRSCLKEDLQASPAEMLYGTTLRIPGEFFVTNSAPADPGSFAGKLRELFNIIRPVPASHHGNYKPFRLKLLATCTHVYQRVDSVRKPLVPPYVGPFKVVRRMSEKVYIILVNGVEKAVTTDALIPAHQDTSDPLTPPSSTAPTASSPASEPSQVNQESEDNGPSNSEVQSEDLVPSNSDTRPSVSDHPVVQKRVSFASQGKLTKGGVPVAVAPPGLLAPSRSRRKQLLQPRAIY